MTTQFLVLTITLHWQYIVYCLWHEVPNPDGHVVQ